MILQIVKYGDPVLRAKGERVEMINDHVRELAADMVDTMRNANGLGLAAQQVGEALQMFVLEVPWIDDRPSGMIVDGQEADFEAMMPMVLINPEIELSSEREIGSEGCLSFPEMSADIPRATEVTVRAMDLDGNKVEFSATGLLARAVQHEFDHLQGVLFIDRMNSAAKASLAGKLKRLQKEGGRR